MVFPKYVYNESGAHLCKNEEDVKKLGKVYESPADVPKKEVKKIEEKKPSRKYIKKKAE